MKPGPAMPSPVPINGVPGAAGAEDGWLEVHVVFSGHAQIRWLRLLQPGFRHCFAALSNGRAWITFDPLSPATEIAVQPVPGSFDLPAWYRTQGLVTVPARLRRGHEQPAPVAPFTCVEAVKRLLGIHARRIVTPFQLFCHLQADPSRPLCGADRSAHSDHEGEFSHGQSASSAKSAARSDARNTLACGAQPAG